MEKIPVYVSASGVIPSKKKSTIYLSKASRLDTFSTVCRPNFWNASKAKCKSSSGSVKSIKPARWIFFEIIRGMPYSST